MPGAIARICLHVIQDTNADIICLQEVLAHQLDYLSKHLASYTMHGIGRKDGHRHGEFVPIFYNAQRYSPIRAGHFWLSEMPKIAGSKSWGARNPRMCSWIMLHDQHPRHSASWSSIRISIMSQSKHDDTAPPCSFNASKNTSSATALLFVVTSIARPMARFINNCVSKPIYWMPITHSAVPPTLLTNILDPPQAHASIGSCTPPSLR